VGRSYRPNVIPSFAIHDSYDLDEKTGSTERIELAILYDTREPVL